MTMLPHAANWYILLQFPLAYVKNPKTSMPPKYITWLSVATPLWTEQQDWNVTHGNALEGKRYNSRGRCERSRSRDYGLRSSSVELTVSHCIYTATICQRFILTLFSYFYVHITYKITANEIFQTKFCKNCFFYFRTYFTDWKVMSGKRCQLYRGERSELNGVQYTLGRDYGSITSQYTLGRDYGMSQVWW